MNTSPGQGYTDIHIPLTERLKGLPGLFGIRLGEQPEYIVLDTYGTVEIRQYSAYVIAKTHGRGLHKDAAEEGFLRLAAYIFGDNKGHLEMPMTAPVLLEPVTQGWDVSFILPKEFSLESAPAPHDMLVELSHVAPKKVAVLRYSGITDDQKMREKSIELTMALEEQTKYANLSAPCYAQYDAPHTIPVFRRNEVMVDVIESVLN